MTNDEEFRARVNAEFAKDAAAHKALWERAERAEASSREWERRYVERDFKAIEHEAWLEMVKALGFAFIPMRHESGLEYQEARNVRADNLERELAEAVATIERLVTGTENAEFASAG